MNTIATLSIRGFLLSMLLTAGLTSHVSAQDTYEIFFASGGQVERNGALIAPPAGACGIRVTSVDGYEWRQSPGYPSNGFLISGSNSPSFNTALVEMTFLPTCSAFDQDAVVLFDGGQQMPPAGANVLVAQGDGTWVDSEGDPIGGVGGGPGIDPPDFDLVVERREMDFVRVQRLTAQIQAGLMKTATSPLFLRDSDVAGDLNQILDLVALAESAFARLESSEDRMEALLAGQRLGVYETRVLELLDELEVSRLAGESALARARGGIDSALEGQSRSVSGSLALQLAGAGDRSSETAGLIDGARRQFDELRVLSKTALPVR